MGPSKTRINKRGPAVAAQTVKINKQGVARLSPDLFIAKRFVAVPNPSRGVLTLVASPTGDVAVWRSSPRAKSGHACLLKPLRAVGVKRCYGTFSAHVIDQGASVEILLEKKKI